MSDLKDRKKIHLSSEAVGNTLTEVVRAYAYQGTPSAIAGRILEGIIQFRNETEAANEVTPDDRRVISQLDYRLRQIQDDLRKLEDQVYAAHPDD
jgi:hypothetical protein